MTAVCMKCGALAVWELAPADSYGEYCDDCVPRGCSCNIIDLGNPRARKQHRDERGRLLPCCEYWWWEEGFKPSPPDKVARHRKLMAPYLARLRAEGKLPASVDTRPEGGDPAETGAPFTSGAVPQADAQTPPQPQSESNQ